MGEKDSALLDHVPEMLTISDPEGRVIYANPATERVTGFAPEEFVGRDPFETIHPEDRPRCEEALEALLRAPGLSLELEHRIRHKNGEWCWVEGTFVSLFDEPEVGGMLATLRDVNERKRAEEEMRLQARLLGAVGEAVVAVGADGRVSYWNRAAEEAYGWTAEEALGRPLGEMVVPEGLRGRAEEIMEAVSAGRRWSGHFEVLRKDGSAFTALATNEPVFGEDGDLVGVICVFRDVTDRSRAEEALKESEERHRLIVEGARDYAIITTDPDGTIASWSPGAEAVYGWSAEEVLGKPVAITFTPQDRESGEPEKELAVAGREGLAADVRWHLRKDGSRVFIEGSTRAMRGGEGGEPRRFVKVGQDVTERRALEEERERLRAVELTARAEASERERISRELHDRVAHNMAVVHQSLQLHAALARSDPERAAEKLERAAEATRSALAQTRDLSAQLARSGARETPEGLGSALRDLLDDHAPPGVEATLSVEGDEASVPERVGEQAYLVMREAVRNAVAHSGCCRVQVSLEVENAALHGRVEDDGVGFDPRGGPGGEDVTLPAGMGLLSMRERTERLGGRLEIVSGPGRGTTVEVRIPLAD